MISLFFNDTTRGPGKVAKNLILGLNKLGVEFNVNPTKISDDDNIISLQINGIMNTEHISGSIIGPNICVLPTDNSVVMNQQYNKLIVPCQWVKNTFMKWLPEDKLFMWAVGIDTDLFLDKSNETKTNDCLIYLKRRSQVELNVIKELLIRKGQSFEVIEYGSYNEHKFIETISRSRYGIIIDNTESQGIAIEEMMSCNLPLLVWDVTHWVDRGEEHKIEATSIPYWDERCGLSFTKSEEIEITYNKFINNLNTFKPRDYILDNLTLEKSAQKLLNILK